MPIKYNRDSCAGCFECVDVCPEEIFEKDGDKVKLKHPETCVECEACINVCSSEGTLKLE